MADPFCVGAASNPHAMLPGCLPGVSVPNRLTAWLESLQGLWEAQLSAARLQPSQPATSGGADLSTSTSNGGQLPLASPLTSSVAPSAAPVDFLALLNSLQGTSTQQQQQQQQAGLNGNGVRAGQVLEASHQQQGFMPQQAAQPGCSLPRSASASPGRLPAASEGYAEARVPGNSVALQHLLGREAPPQLPPPQVRVSHGCGIELAVLVFCDCA